MVSLPQPETQWRRAERVPVLGSFGACKMSRPKATSYDSLRAAAAGMGIPIEVLRRAKRSGAAGFRGSRVFPDEVLKTLGKTELKTPDMFESKEDAQIQKLVRECRKMDRLEAIAMGDLTPTAQYRAWMVATAEKIKAILVGKLKNELPPKLEGLRAPEIGAKMDPVIAEIVELFRA
jgi:hypothetical protein